ncbi:MAG TPA: hypothetical protein VHI52_07545 [Verrucomicrobiae bacterium]|nr:hypothetical protein [Verrucomicrobiae bacterium]
MKTWRFLAAIVLPAALLSCKTSEDARTHVTLIQVSDNRSLLSIAIGERVGIWGPEGYVRSRTAGFWAALEGAGPVYINPHFQDDSSDFPCIGSITVDRDHNKVTLDMHRVLSKPGEATRTKPHPANGTYGIEAIRKARPEEAWF